MFAYNTRTEIRNGTRFIEKDILLFDYTYTGDILFQVDAVLNKSGFGFVIQEDNSGELQTADNTILISFASDNSYKVISKEGIDQVTAVHQFIESATNLYDPEGVIFFFKKHDETLTVSRAIRQQDGTYYEIRLMEYKLRHDIIQYRVGIYSNGGNTVTFASVKTEAPSNWISNVFNAGGGRIKWIRDGFIIDEAEYDIEVEAEDIQMKAGTYWFDYVCDNPDMKAYVYLTERKHTATKRPRGEIIATMVDERKNILEEEGKFVVPVDHAINIKFKGKWGTVTNICVKSDKLAGFVETGYGTTIRPGSRLIFDLDKITAFHIKGTILSVPIQDPGETRKYNLFKRGRDSVAMNLPVELEKSFVYDFTKESGIVEVNGETFATLNDDTDNKLVAFENMTAIIDELIVTLNNGDIVNIMLQKTLKVTVGKTIKSPIFVLDEDDNPFDLSSSHRLLAEKKSMAVLYNALNPIHLSYYPVLSNMELRLYGVPSGAIIRNKEGESIRDITDIYTKLSYNPDKEGLIAKSVEIPYSIRKPYKYIVVEYRAIRSYRYIFTNWEREIFNLKDNKRMYLEAKPLSITDGIVIYGIKKNGFFNPDLLYYIEDEHNETSIALCAYTYDILSQNMYSINAINRIVISQDDLLPYEYLIVDYLKDDSYSINEKDDYYEVDISSSKTTFKLMYDSEDGDITNTYRALTLEQMTRDAVDYAVENDDFIVLEEYA